MNFKTLSFTLSLMLAAFPLLWAADPQDRDGESHILKVYDFAAFFAPPTNLDMEESINFLSMVPINPDSEAQPLWECQVYGYMENYEDLLAFVADRLPEFIEPELFEYESAYIRTLGSSLYLKAPEKTHKKVQAFIDFLRGRWDQHISIDLKVFYMTSATPLKSLDSHSIQNALNRGTLKSLLHRNIKTERGGLFELKEGIETLVGWSAYCEIAERSVINGPEIRNLFVGLDLALRPVFVSDGKKVALNLFGKASRFIEPLNFKELNLNGRIALDQSTQDINLTNKIDDPKIEFASVAAHLVAGQGETTGVQVAFPHHKGVGSLVILATPSFKQPIRTVELDHNKILSAIDFSYLQIQDTLKLHLSKAGNIFSRNVEDYDRECDDTLTLIGPPIQARSYRCEDLYCEFMSILEELQPDLLNKMYEKDVEPIDYLLGNDLILLTTHEHYNALSELVRSSQEADPKTVDVKVKFVETSGPAIITSPDGVIDRGVLKGVVNIPMCSGTTAGAYAGYEGIMVTGHEAEVATASACFSPRCQPFLDGAIVYLHHIPSPSLSKDIGKVRATVFINQMDASSMRSVSPSGFSPKLDKILFNNTVFTSEFSADGKNHILGSLTRNKEGKLSTLYAIGIARNQ